MQRRTFHKVLGSGLLVAASASLIRGYLFANDGALFASYEKALLTDAKGEPIRLSALSTEVPYVFYYPHVSTPCFLIKLPKPATQEVALTAASGETYLWKGGVGKEGKVVAFSAICSHALTHPNPEDSFITYIPKDGKTLAYEKGGVVVCSSHLSAFDPTQGAKNVAGEAKDPLASIVLEYDETNDKVYASGVLGVEMFHQYFRIFRPQLADRFQSARKAKQLVKISTATVALSEFSKEIIQY
ncbi:MAG: Rieske 2Fe-2S domain-containing protein [Campylobacterales bacterium]|nr:Rieske 2Fe-2S domain-containing protein [Campylobacterales bacterium]